MDRMARERENTEPDLAACALQVLAANSVPAAAAALRRCLAACGVATEAVAWQAGDHVACEPPAALLPAPSTLAPLLQTPGTPWQVLHADATGPLAALAAAPGALAQLDAGAAGVLQLCTQRLAELLTLQNLQASVQHLEQSRQLQQALFAIADLASSDQDMDSMGAAEADTAMLLFPHLADLRDIHALALAEMQGLAPPMLQEAYPAAG